MATIHLTQIMQGQPEGLLVFALCTSTEAPRGASPFVRSERLDLDDRRARVHGHSHGLVDPSIKRSRAGLRSVSTSLGVLGATAAIQAAIYVATGSVALLADLIHNFGDALTAVPLGAAFLLRSARAERYAGLGVVLAIFVSACVAGVFAIEKIVSPQAPEHLLALGVAGAVGFVGNEVAALVALGLPLADPIIAIVITAVILRITWQSWLTVSGRSHRH